jgi:tyrosyl-tRNA synthetase
LTAEEKRMRPVEEQMPILMQGVDYGDDQIRKNMEEELRERLKENRPLRVYLGVDPSAPDIHLGHTVPIRKLQQFQELGHDVTFLIGNFTGLIGDPSDKDKRRPMLSPEQLMANARTYTDQAFKILDPQKTRIRFNADWLSKLSFADVIKLASHFTVAQFLERDNFSKRFAKGDPIYLHEFFYALMQGYDAVAQDTDVQVGGTDQLFNLLAGRVLQRAFDQRPQIAVTLPILVGTDGHIRMSKSIGNAIGINEPPEQMYGKVMSIPDSAILDYFRLVTRYTPVQVESLQAKLSGGAHPRDVKMELAREIVSIFHGAVAAQEAEGHFISVFQQHDLPEDMPEHRLTGSPNIVDLLAEAGLIQTKSEGRRLIQQGGVKVDGKPVSDIEARVEVTGQAVLQIGRRKFIRLIGGQS